MNEVSERPNDNRNIWLRGLFMLLMALTFEVCGTILCVVAIIQFVLMLTSGSPNARLVAFGHSLGDYLRQITNFQIFATEEVPFPFNEWPPGE